MSKAQQVTENLKKLREYTNPDRLTTIKTELKKAVISGWKMSFSYPKSIQTLTLKIQKLPKKDLLDLLYSTRDRKVSEYTWIKSDLDDFSMDRAIEINFPPIKGNFEEKARERLTAYFDPKSKLFDKVLKLVTVMGMYNYNDSDPYTDYSDSSDTVKLIIGKDSFTLPDLV